MAYSSDRWEKNLKYPILLFFLLLIVKIIYIVVESQYNYSILQTLTQPSLDTKAIDELNDLGHKISSVGLTLLLMPLFYFLFKRYKKLTMYLLLSFSTIVSYVTIKHSLNVLVDTIIEHNSDKRYNAYYTNIFKYGVLNGYFTYDSFISSQHIFDNVLTIEDKILIINTFLITYADKALIEKLLDRGSDKISELYIDMDQSLDYDKSYKDFQKFSSEINRLWNHFVKERNKLIEHIGRLKVESNIKTAYLEMQDELKHEFKAYQLTTKDLNKKINEETTLLKLDAIEKELKRYYKYKRYKKAQRQYREEMNKRFGHYIDPDRWCNNYICPTKSQIKRVLKEELEYKVQDKLHGLPIGLSFKAFINHIQVKTNVAKKLKAKGIYITQKFDYSYKAFKSAYFSSLSKKENLMIDTFYTTMKKELGENDIKLSYTWNDFILSQYITKKIRDNRENIDTQMLTSIQRLLISKNIGDFREKVYLPSIQEKIQNKIYTEEDFKQLPEAMRKGDDALKLLYVPPFALALSMIALLLNLVTVFMMIYMLYPSSHKKVKFFIRPILFVLLLSIPFIFSEKINTPLIKESIKDDTSIEKYLSFLRWLQFYENLNSDFYKTTPIVK